MRPRPRTPRPAAAALAAALVAAAGCAPGRSPPARPPSPLVGTPLVLRAADLEGRTVDVAAVRGKVRVVDFWATWCEPCREALPALDRMARELGSRDLAVFAVSFDEDPAQLPAFLAQVPISIPVLHDRGGDALSERFGVRRLPTTLVVDRRGVVRFVHEGWTPERAREERRQVEQLMAEPQEPPAPP